MDLTVSPHVAVVLSITPDHLNWHRDLDEYYLAKGRIAAYQSTKDSVVYVADSPVATAVAETSRGQRIPVAQMKACTSKWMVSTWVIPRC